MESPSNHIQSFTRDTSKSSLIRLTAVIPDKIVLYKSRFLMLFLFSMCTLINAVGYISFGPIT